MVGLSSRVPHHQGILVGRDVTATYHIEHTSPLEGQGLKLEARHDYEPALNTRTYQRFHDHFVIAKCSGATIGVMIS